MLAALAMPPLLLIGLGAMELNQVLSDKQHTQDVADAAALMGAQQLALAPSGADTRAQSFAQAQLVDMSARSTVTVTASIVNPSTIKVAIDTHRDSFFGNLFPPGGFFTHAEASAVTANIQPLCILILGQGSTDAASLTQTTQVSAPKCVFHANPSISVASGAMLSAVAVETGATASGPISPNASTGAPAIPDPFSSLAWQTSCAGATNIIFQTGGTMHVPPGVHGSVSIQSTGTLIFDPGDHYFCGNWSWQDSGVSIQGTDVDFIYLGGTSPNWGSGNTVSISGRQSGPLAGFAIIADRATTGNFTINSDPIASITGVIYVPNATMVVTGSSTKSVSSAWTVFAAKSFESDGSAHLTVNANYSGSSVPVPQGVGNNRAPTRISH